MPKIYRNKSRISIKIRSINYHINEHTLTSRNFLCLSETRSRFHNKHHFVTITLLSVDTAIFDGNPTVERIVDSGTSRVATYRNKDSTNCQTKPRARLADENESQGCIRPIGTVNHQLSIGASLISLLYFFPFYI